MRVGINADIFIEWAGGIDFLRIILKGLNHINKHTPVEVIVFIPEKKISNVNLFKVFLKRVINIILGHQKYSLQLPKPLDIEGAKLILGKDCKVQFVTYNFSLKNLEREALSLGVEVLLPCFHSLGEGFKVSWVGYLYDFQHKYYPHFFSSKEIQLRDSLFCNMQDEARVIMVNANAVKNDAEKFFPGKHAQIISLPFCPLYRDESIDFEEVHLPENLPKKYFLISNQFWQHKDHKTAIEALSMFHKEYGLSDVHLICTGEMHDYRAPGYVDSIQELVMKLSLEDKVHFLGYISKALQLRIMRGAISLVQPTLFEGGPGGGAVYEALAIGVNVVLSDIPVNQEIKRANCLFFEAGNPSSLAKKLFEVIGLERLSLWQLKQQQEIDVSEFSQTLHTIIQTSIAGNKKGLD